MMTDYPKGITSFGAPVLPYKSASTTANGGAAPIPNKHIWVHGNVGNNGNSGLSPDRPLRTMQAAFNKLSSGDVIHFNGNIAEDISTPAGIFDVTIIGEGNQPRHSDAHTTNNGYSSATWKTGGGASTPLLTVRQQGWKLINILFDGPASAAAVQLFRDAGSGDAEDDASHAHILGCKFVAGQNHIEFKGGLSQCVIEGNLFFGSTDDSLVETVGAGVGTNNYHRVINNEFHNNATHIDVDMNYATIKWNTFGKWSTKGILMSGGSNNMVWGNYLSGDYDAGYLAGTDDEWAGNYSMDITSDEVGDNAITTAVPVA
jgi:hypothetical protein